MNEDLKYRLRDRVSWFDQYQTLLLRTLNEQMSKKYGIILD